MSPKSIIGAVSKPVSVFMTMGSRGQSQRLGEAGETVFGDESCVKVPTTLTVFGEKPRLMNPSPLWLLSRLDGEWIVSRSEG